MVDLLQMFLNTFKSW